MPTFVLATTSNPGTAQWTDSTTIPGATTTYSNVNLNTQVSAIASTAYTFSSVNISTPTNLLKFKTTLGYQVDGDALNNSGGPRTVRFGCRMFNNNFLTGPITLPTGYRVVGKYTFSVPYYTDSYLWGVSEFNYRTFENANPVPTTTYGIQAGSVEFGTVNQNVAVTISPRIETDFQPGDSVQVFSGYPYIRIGV